MFDSDSVILDELPKKQDEENKWSVCRCPLLVTIEDVGLMLVCGRCMLLGASVILNVSLQAYTIE